MEMQVVPGTSVSRHTEVRWTGDVTSHILNLDIKDFWQFYPRERNPASKWIRGWVGPRSDLDVSMKRNVLGTELGLPRS